MSVVVVGLREAINNLAQFGHDITDLAEAHDAIAGDVAAQAVAGAPVDTEALRSTVRVLEGDPSQAVVLAGSATVDYALIQDRRTDFLRGPGNDEPRFRRQIEDALEDATRRHNLT